MGGVAANESELVAAAAEETTQRRAPPPPPPPSQGGDNFPPGNEGVEVEAGEAAPGAWGGDSFSAGNNSPSGRVTAGVEGGEEESVEEMWVVLMASS